MQDRSSNFLTLAVVIGLVLVVGAAALLIGINNNKNAGNQTATTPTAIGETPVNDESDNPSSTPTTPSAGDESFTTAELAAFNGKNGKDCYVAVDGTVYEINSGLWVNGEHTTSMGQATCGKDLTTVINSSPHGKSVLKSPAAVKVGTLS
jgi:predicted heme/steroid binding protein